ncbi:MAG: hypothetical protein F6K14_27620 [Symploca sp. SIO2C1]|nr:hypothetical protein [Symploca sp. SIO2C1]
MSFLTNQLLVIFDSEPVEASNHDEAEEECQKLASEYGVELFGVEERGKKCKYESISF